MTRTVWLIRHGESTANAGEKTRDPASVPLTPLGWQQAEETATKFKAAPDLIVISPYLRTRQTAAPTITRYPSVPVETWPVQEFTYLSPRRYADTSASERRPAVDAYWRRCDPAYIDGEDAESFAQMLNRVREAARRIEALGLSTIAVFTHGQIMQSWEVLAQEPQASDRENMLSFSEAYLARPYLNCEWLSGADYARVARS